MTCRQLLSSAQLPFALLILVFAMGCAHGTISPLTEGLATLSGQVGSVAVKVDRSSIGSRIRAYRQNGGSSVVAREITSRLTARGLHSPSGNIQVDVNVTAFRLRSTEAVYWVGLVLGPDKLEGTVEMTRKGGEPSRYSFELSGHEDFYFKIYSEARFKSLARELADKIASVISE